MSKAISDIFNVDPVVPVSSNLPMVIDEEDTIDADASLARNNIRELMKMAEDALRESMHVAVGSESPRAFEVVANLIATASDLNSKLLDTHAVQGKINAASKQVVNATQNNSTTNNVIFNGTPAELAKLLKANNVPSV